jgi:hypothetical protein
LKTALFALSALVLGFFSVSSFAERITISGTPVILTQQGDAYILPSDYTATGDYFYVTVNGTNKVCYQQQQPTLASLEPTTLNVQVSGKAVQWTCYNYDEKYFIVNP